MDRSCSNNVVGAPNVRVDSARLPLEAFTQSWIFRKMLGKDFDRHCAIEASVFRLVDFAHPARAERRQDFIGAESSSGSYRHRQIAIFAKPRAPLILRGCDAGYNRIGKFPDFGSALQERGDWKRDNSSRHFVWLGRVVEHDGKR